MSTTPTLSSTTLPDLSLPKSASKPSTPRAPRIDIEPLYGAVKMAISDADWTLYKTSLSAFLLGNLNQEELSGRLDRIFSRAASSSSEAGGLSRAGLERAHNALVMGVYANVWRDAPEAGIASWVSSSDKLSGSVPKGTGDESEKRLKHEVMHISRRERKRLKTMHQGGGAGGSAFDFAPVDTVGGIMMEYHEARRVKLPDAGPAAQAGGYGKTSTYTSFSPSLSVRILTRTLLLTPPSRLGPRNPQTLHRTPLRRNPRIPHSAHHLRPPPPHLLRIGASPRPRSGLRRPRQSRHRDLRQGGPHRHLHNRHEQWFRLRPHSRVQEAGCAGRGEGRCGGDAARRRERAPC